jgi:hypothetical protein
MRPQVLDTMPQFPAQWVPSDTARSYPNLRVSMTERAAFYSVTYTTDPVRGRVPCGLSSGSVLKGLRTLKCSD